MAITNSSDVDFMVSSEGLYDKGKLIDTEKNNIKKAIEDIKSARTLLNSWVSENKDKYDNKLLQTLPKMEEMVEILSSFGGVAIQTSERVKEAEHAVATAIDNETAA